MSSIGIRELADRTREAQLAMGLSPHTVWEHYMTALLPIVKLHEQEGKGQFDRGVIDEYIHQIEERHDLEEIGSSHYNRLRHGADRLI